MILRSLHCLHIEVVQLSIQRRPLLLHVVHVFHVGSSRTRRHFLLNQPVNSVGAAPFGEKLAQVSVQPFILLGIAVANKCASCIGGLEVLPTVHGPYIYCGPEERALPLGAVELLGLL